MTLRKFLIIDDNADGRSLLNRTLLRKFPSCLVTECGEASTATTAAATERFDAILVHRAGEVGGLDLVPTLRRVAPTVPIVYLSGYDRTEEALKAGATRFLNYDAWLNIGVMVEELLEQYRQIPMKAAVGASVAPFPAV